MRRGSLIAVVSLTVLITFVTALWLANFNVSTSQTHSEAQIGTSRATPPDTPEPAPPGQLALYVVGGERLVEATGPELRDALQMLPWTTDVVLVDTLPAPPERPVAMVELRPEVRLWTPVYARATVTAQIFYSSDGDLSWRDQGSAVLEPSTTHVSGNVTIYDDTRGLISRPAYDRHLGQQIAGQVQSSLAQALSGDAG